ncbi:MAG: phosphatidylglycerol lysyltransferase domain-containing protein [Oscillospiraceae bacterium]|jgi:hypothetical protein|nr:phosphatidylglycerol lysyltransferase domain-containing protein [Oscillospiraceae bacterium]
MIDFKPLILDQKPEIDRILRDSDLFGCEFCFGNFYIWNEYYEFSVSLEDGVFTAFSPKTGTYVCPVGATDLKSAVLRLKEDADNRGNPLVLRGIDSGRKMLLEEAFPGGFDFMSSEDIFDYLYKTSDLAQLPGKRYHKKRTHIARFEERYDYVFEPISSKNIGECRRLYEKWYSEHVPQNPKLIFEHLAMERCFEDYFTLGFSGGLVRITGVKHPESVSHLSKPQEDAQPPLCEPLQTVAFTFGEPINSRVFGIHAEKADPKVQGAYPIVNREFAKTLTAYEYLNREEDLGLEGLRRAKQSYYPAILLEKFEAVWK